jgi:hypothetical protein
MSGLPMLPSSLLAARELLPPKEWAKRAVERGYAIVEKIDFWLAMRSVWWLVLIADRKLNRLADELDRACDEAEKWLAKPRTLKRFTPSFSDPTEPTVYGIGVTTTDHRPRHQSFIDCAGRLHVRDYDAR